MSPLEAVPDALAAAKSKRIVRWTMTGRFWMLRALGAAIAIVATTHQPVPGAQNTTAGTSPVAMTLDVDASDAPMKILHATMSIRAASGPMSLFYPKWIPGEHMASGPIA